MAAYKPASAPSPLKLPKPKPKGIATIAAVTPPVKSPLKPFLYLSRNTISYFFTQS